MRYEAFEGRDSMDLASTTKKTLVENLQSLRANQYNDDQESSNNIDVPSDVEPEVPRASSKSPPVEDPAPEACPEGAPGAEERRRKKTLAWKCCDPDGVPKAQGTKAKAKVHHS